MSNLIRIYNADIHGDFTDSVLTWQRFIEVVNKLPGVTVVNSIKHDFPGGGFSGLILLAESHAAIHTFPEKNIAWMELATCGDPHALTVFAEKIQALTSSEANLT